ncbi:MAG TPA: sigma-54 dependent transcriptional regulator [Terriglobales bacterium]|nr:sigma-54 dependent transcriptional regulator [Terriglobales bacterium]
MSSAALAADLAPGRHIVILTTEESVLPDIEQFFLPSYRSILLNSAEALVPLMKQVPLDGIVLDLDTAAGTTSHGLELLAEIRRLSPDVVLIALTRSRSRNIRLKAGELGADEFFVAPVDAQELKIVLDRALEKRMIEMENRRLRDEITQRYSFCDLIGSSEAMQRVYEAIQRVAQSSSTVMLRGESGTGKELAARAIVAVGPRAAKPFISVNCAALPENLIETELFGHEKGAFTDAHEARAGRIEQADSGTLFLDEIGTLPLNLQAKLLRVLEDRAVQRIGGKTSRKIDFRLLTATNDNLEELVRAGRFREDLYYRIHVIPIFLPPLRERPGDIPLLVEHFVRMYCAADRVPLKRVDPEVIDILAENPWPGNIRELENLIQRLVLMTSEPVITLKHLPSQLLYTSTTQQEALLIPEEGIDFDEEMARIEVAYLEAALRRTGENKALAAKLLRMDKQKMHYLCRKYAVGRD